MTSSASHSQEKRIKVGVIFGGRSPEHEVSLVSAASVIHALDPKKYEILPIGITADGRWLASSDALKLLKEKTPVEKYPEHTIVPNPHHHGLMSLNRSLTSPALYHVDVLFPVMHGVFGEDGTIQGLFELAGIPYVGAGVLGSAIGMDKVIQKQLLRQGKILVTPDLWFTADEFNRSRKKILASAARSIRFPAFVKPANLGSSIGISKVRNARELETAIDLASTYDRKILVEKAVPRAREIECSVLGNDNPAASLPGEVVPSNEFYDYDAKYVDGKSTAIVPAKLPQSIVRKIQDIAVRAFRILDCAGMARVDFLIPAGTNKVYLNEINTIPGFTSISMYPKLWEASGLSYPDLLDRLIGLALERHEAKSHLHTTYKPKSSWYKR